MPVSGTLNEGEIIGRLGLILDRLHWLEDHHDHSGDVRDGASLSVEPGLAADHGDLLGLGDDDHAQYLTNLRHDDPVRHTLGVVVDHDDHGNLSGVTADQHHNQTHVLAGADHTASGLTAGNVLRASGAATFAWAQPQHGDLGGVTADQHHNQQHAIDGADHTGKLDHDALDGLDDDDHGAIYPGLAQIEHITGAWTIDDLVVGELHAAIFTKDLIEAHAGTLVLGKSAGALAAAMVVPGAGTWTLTIKDPPAGGFLFDNSDICRVRGETGSGIGDTWFTVSERVDNEDGTQSYTCTWAYGTQSVTYGTGVGAIDYGVAGQGILMMTAELTGAPFYAVLTHNGKPWLAYPADADGLRVWSQLGNLNGQFGIAAGTNRYGQGLGDYAGRNYLRYTPEEDFLLQTGNGAIKLDINGMTLKAGDGIPNRVSWQNDATDALIGDVFSYIDGGLYQTLVRSVTETNTQRAVITLEARETDALNGETMARIRIGTANPDTIGAASAPEILFEMNHDIAEALYFTPLKIQEQLLTVDGDLTATGSLHADTNITTDGDITGNTIESTTTMHAGGDITTHTHLGGAQLLVNSATDYGAAIECAGAMRATGNSTLTGGEGLELYYDTNGIGHVLAYDRTNAHYAPLWLAGLPVLAYAPASDPGSCLYNVPSANMGSYTMFIDEANSRLVIKVKFASDGAYHHANLNLLDGGA